MKSNCLCSFASFYFAQRIFEIHSYWCHVAVTHLSSPLNSNPLRIYHNPSILLLSDIHWICFIAIMKKATISRVVLTAWYTQARDSPQYRRGRSIILGCEYTYTQLHWAVSNCFPKWLYQFTMPIGGNKSSMAHFHQYLVVSHLIFASLLGEKNGISPWSFSKPVNF